MSKLATDEKLFAHIFSNLFYPQTWLTRLVSLQFYMLSNHDLLVNILASDPCTIHTRLRKKLKNIRLCQSQMNHMGMIGWYMHLHE